MSRKLRFAALHVLLATLLLRALVPAGWMPGQAQLGEASFVICAADGSLQHGVPGKDSGIKPHQPCAFGATAQFFALPDAAAIAPPAIAALSIAGVIASAAPIPDAPHTPHSPRAPPLSA